MKLWDVLATCLLLLSSVASRPLYQNTQPTRRTYFPRSYRDSVSLSVEEPLFQREDHSLQDISMDDQYDTAGPYPEQFEDVMDLIEAAIGRLRRSSETSSNSKGRREQRQRGAANTRGTRGEGRGHGVKRRSRGRGGGRAGKGGRGEKGKEKTWVQSRGCLLKEIYLNVTDLGLGHRTKEALIFRYCSGPCSEAETNYDKILMNLTHKKKLDNDAPSRTCCRPIAFDDDISFLDDDLVYHTLKKHSARKCACV